MKQSRKIRWSGGELLMSIPAGIISFCGWKAGDFIEFGDYDFKEESITLTNRSKLIRTNPAMLDEDEDDQEEDESLEETNGTELGFGDK